MPWTPPTAAVAVGSWNHLDQGEAIALDIPFSSFAANQAFYSSAFVGAVATCLNVSYDTILITAFQASAVDTVIIYFNVIWDGTSSSSSEVVTVSNFAVKSLFTSGTLGASAGTQLLNAFRMFGLPSAAAFYRVQNAPPPPLPHPSPPDHPQTFPRAPHPPPTSHSVLRLLITRHQGSS